MTETNHEWEERIRAMAIEARAKQERREAEARAEQERREAIRIALAEEAERAKVYQLAFWPQSERAMPEDFIACALFTACKRPPYQRRVELASINGLTVIFTGKRLTQVHADVFMGIMHFARGYREGSKIRFRGRALLELIGRGTHQHQREQLLGWLSELGAAEILIQRPDEPSVRMGGNLLPTKKERDADGGTTFTIEINRELARMLSTGFAHIDWNVRKQLQNKPIALWLQMYFSHFKQPVSVTRLHALSGSGASLKEFRRKLRTAFEELVAAGGPRAGIDRETDIVVLYKLPPTRQRRPSSNDIRQTVMPFAMRDKLTRP